MPVWTLVLLLFLFQNYPAGNRIMKKHQSSMFLTITLLAFAVGAPSFAQDNATPKTPAQPATGDDAQMMATMVEMAKPGENHKILEGLVGSWTYTSKWWMHPDAPPMESTGTCAVKSLMDGRYFVSEHSGKMSMPGADGKLTDVPFQGTSTEGYDNAKKKFFATWIDNMGTGIMLMEGTYDPSAKTMTYLGEEEPLPGMKLKVREVLKYTDKDHRKMEYYEVHGDSETKVMEIAYTRS
jgi:hypothetical protein